MSGVTLFSSAWDAQSTESHNLYGYTIQALNPGLIKCAALGNKLQLQTAHTSISTGMLAVVGSSLALFAIDGPAMEMKCICDAPVFSKVLDIIFSGNNSGLNGVYIVLSDDGQLVLVDAEAIEDKRRLKAIERYSVLTQEEDGSAVRLLRKLVADPLARCVAAVSWIDFIEISMLLWDTQNLQPSRYPQISNERIQISTGEAICDAAVLIPLPTETQRILLLAAVMDGEKQSYFLHLYEIWTYSTTSNKAPSLVAKLPLPLDLDTPLYIVPLPQFPEHFVLITETEVVLGSALQLLSGDIHLYRRPLLPETQSKDLPRSACVAGTALLAHCDINEDSYGKSLLRSPLLSRRIPAGSPHLRDTKNDRVQKLYISMQSGILLRLYAAPFPLLSLTKVEPESVQKKDQADQPSPGDVMVYLGSESSYAKQLEFDYIFLSGDCAPNTMMRITAESNDSVEAGRFSPQASDPIASTCAPIRWSYPVLENQSPMVDFTLLSGMVYATSGRMSCGGIFRGQFGHSTRLLSEVKASDEKDICAMELVAPLWSFYVLSGHSGGKATSCIVLQHANTNVPIIEGCDEWKVFSPLYQIISNHHLSFIGNITSNLLLCVSHDSIDIVDLTPAELGLARVMSAADNQVFTHGACLASASRDVWAAVAIQSKSLSALHKTLVRVFSITPSYTASMDSGQVDFAEVDVEADVSCMRLFAVGTSTILAIGTYTPELRLYRLEAGSSVAPKVIPIQFDLPLTFAKDNCEQMGDSMSVDNIGPIDSCAGSAVSDICVLGKQDVSYVLAGLRDGHLSWKAVYTSWLAGAGDCSHMEEAIIGDSRMGKVGKVPVSFAIGPLQPDLWSSGAVICSDSLHLAKIGALCQLDITPCQSTHMPLVSIHRIVPLLAESAVNSGPSDCADDGGSIGDISQSQRFFATYIDGRAGTLEIELAAECSFSIYTVNAEPKRLVVDQNTGLLLVASKVPASLDREIYGWTSELKAVDPKDGCIHDKVQFRPFELVCSLATWHIRGQKSYRYLCVGTIQFTEGDERAGHMASQPTGGRLVIYNIKQTKRKSRPKRTPEGSHLESMLSSYELKYVWESDRRGPVSALASLGDSYLVVAVNSSCLVLKLDVVQKRLIECCECSLRFAATSLDVRGYDIVVGSQRESVNVLRFMPSVDPNGCDRLELVHSARFGGYTVDARFVTDDLVAGIDCNGFLYAVGIPKNPTEFALDYVLGIHLDTECTRMHVGRLIQRPSQPQHVLSWSSSTNDHRTGCLPDADFLVVSTLSGALWALLRIGKDAYELLRKVEQTMLDISVLHPAYPLVPSSDGLANRTGKSSRIQPLGVVDGTYLTMFVSQLTRDEQIEVVSSSPDLIQAALALPADHRVSEANSASAAATIVARLISTLNHTCIC
ncbi:hypothetical protein IWW36_003081 [Coemansia brasiliensis]|uniref:RSE1/DDB1/CPSF1 C-terminal domain-containing protein n=1 Tax=Coemansia brasiliensis TaxID=2650707 RepID=A0A9W8M0E4_9FUNG|nr:hypothetical protein IWW36_003081 [Coemansia brasiliensis]